VGKNSVLISIGVAIAAVIAFTAYVITNNNNLSSNPPPSASVNNNSDSGNSKSVLLPPAKVPLSSSSETIKQANCSIDAGAADRVAKNRLYLQQANILINQMYGERKNMKAAYDARENATSSSEQAALDQQMAASNQTIDRILQNIHDIEKLNQALFVPPPDIEQKLFSGQKELMQKYINKTSPSYVPNNPVALVDTDLLNRTLVIWVNPDKIAPDRSNIPTETCINGIPVQIKYGKIELVDYYPYNKITDLALKRFSLTIPQQT
jgi:hypothetical protein